eukprot:jgi/Picsp_1/3354/NSC_06192-R1_2 peptidase
MRHPENCTFESSVSQRPLFRQSLFGPCKGFCPCGRNLATANIGSVSITRSYHRDVMKTAAAKEGRSEFLDRRSAILGWGLISFSLLNQTPAIAGSLFDERIDLIVGIFVKDGDEGNRLLSSGFKWGPDHVVTSYVAINDALKRNLRILTRDRYDKSYELVVHGYDPSLDIAVLRYSEDSRKSGAPSSVDLQLGSEPKVGQNAYILGTIGEGSIWVGSGVISGAEREIQAVNGIKMKHLLQTDVPINAEAGGAGIFDSNGLLLGMLTSGNVPFKTSGYYDSGVHFIVPASTLFETVPALIQYKNSRGKL